MKPFKVGDLVYCNDSYRGFVGKIKKINPKLPYGITEVYFIDIIFKTQKSFNAKRNDWEGFWFSEVNLIIRDTGNELTVISPSYSNVRNRYEPSVRVIGYSRL